MGTKMIMEVPLSINVMEEQKEHLRRLFDASDIAYNFALSYALHQSSERMTSCDMDSYIQYLRKSFSNNPLYPNIMDPNLVDQSIIISSLLQLEEDLQVYKQGGLCPLEKQNFMKPVRSYTVWFSNCYCQNIISKSFIYIGGLNSYVPFIYNNASNLDIITPFSKVIGMRVVQNVNIYSVVLIIEYQILAPKALEIVDAVGIYVEKNDYSSIALSTGEILTLPPEILGNIYKLTALFKELDKRKEQGLPVGAQERSISKFTTLVQKQIPAWHERIANMLVDKYKIICMENQPKEVGIDINFDAHIIKIAGWLQFFTQIYEKKRNMNLDLKIIKINKDPKTLRTCSNCGYQLAYTPFQIEWVCPGCHVQHNLRINAAKNIVINGIK